MQIHSGNFGSKTQIRCGYLAGKYNYSEHIHQFSEIVYCKEGELKLTVDGKCETMRAGDIAVIAPFRIHGFFTPEYTNRWICVFSDDFALGFVSNEEYYGISESCVFHAEPELISYLEKNATDSGEYDMKLNAGLIRAYKVIIGAVYEEYLRHAGKLTPRKQGKTLSSILLYIANHYRENVSLASIGNALGYSPKHVSACISVIKGFSLADLVNSFRTDHAKELLIKTDMKVIDIGMECGYKNEKSFHRAFLKITQVTPGEYRRQKRKGNLL